MLQDQFIHELSRFSHINTRPHNQLVEVARSTHLWIVEVQMASSRQIGGTASASPIQTQDERSPNRSKAQ
jgi:hypothetical protein